MRRQAGHADEPVIRYDDRSRHTGGGIIRRDDCRDVGALMLVLIIRHGRAGDPAEFARSGMGDDLRPLTVEGRKRMRRNAEGLKAIVGKIDVIVTSPLVRTVETAQIVAKAFGKVTMAEL